MRFALLLVSLSVALPARAQTVAPSDFASGLELSIERASKLHALTIPQEVLSALVDRDFGDLCMFDSKGRQLAHSVSTPRLEEATVELPIAYYPLEQHERADTGAVEVSVQRDGQGAITRAFSQRVLQEQARVVAYLLDRGADARPIEGLTLALSAARSFTVQVELESSEDLERFRPLKRGTVASLEHQGKSLRKDLLAVPRTSDRYLRLRFIDPPDSLALEAVSALTLQATGPRERAWLALDGQAEPPEDGQLFAYAMAGAFMPDRYRLALPAGTKLIEATLEGAQLPGGPYHQLDHALFREEAGAPQERTLPGTRDAFFRLRVSEKGGGVHGGAPVLQLGYVPPRVLFEAEGSAPLLLAYGSARARCRKFDEVELKSAADGELLRVDTVRVLRKKTLAGARARKLEPAPRPTRVYVLWAILVLGVGVLALIARKLTRSL
jgi:hypothetical protein